jgi:hypothetical protein
MGLTAIGLATAGLGCAPAYNNESLAVEGNVVPQATLVNGILQCTYSGGQNFYLEGVMDVALSRRFKFVASVKNNLPSLQLINGSGPASLRLDPNTVNITSVHVDMVRSPSTKLTSPFSILNKDVKVNKTLTGQNIASWDVPVVASIGPLSKGLVGMELVPDFAAPGKPIGAEWQQRFFQFTDRARTVERVVLKFQLQGKTAAGGAVVSGTMEYPVDVCWGCLLSVPGNPNVSPEEQWQQCSTMEVAKEFQAPCAVGNYDVLPCAYYCQVCTKDESTKTGPGCDKNFCPQL